MPNILWVDDEIEMLKGHLLFLEGKGYSVATCNNGADALDLVQETGFDAVFLDENMPGLSGLETLEKMKDLLPELPVVMITKSEDSFVSLVDSWLGSLLILMCRSVPIGFSFAHCMCVYFTCSSPIRTPRCRFP